jgi:hypothetical protein
MSIYLHHCIKNYYSYSSSSPQGIYGVFSAYRKKRGSNDITVYGINDTVDEGMGDVEGGQDQLELTQLNDDDQPCHQHVKNEETEESHIANRGFLRALLAVCIGIIHGVAGPGGVLGVMPAVQLQNWGLAYLYLGCFCTSATVTMGCFAAGYGKCSSIIGASKVFGYITAFRVELFSAFLSLFVGALWLTLLYMGVLEKVFP